MTIRVSPDVKAKLDGLARDMRRTASYLAGEAVTSYVEANAWQVDVIRKRLDEASAPDARFVPHEEAMEWFTSLGTDRPLRTPKGKLVSDL